MSSSAAEINERILRALRMERGVLTVKQLAERLGASGNRIRNRVKVLLKLGIVVRDTEICHGNEIGVILKDFVNSNEVRDDL